MYAPTHRTTFAWSLVAIGAALAAAPTSPADPLAASAPPRHPVSPQHRGSQLGTLAPPHRGAEPAQGGIAEGCDGTFVSQNVDHDTITPLNTPHCIEVGVASLATGYARSYVAPETSTVGCVRFAIEFNQGPAWPVSVRVFQGDVHGPYTALTLLAETSLEIPANSGASIRTVTFPGNGPTVQAGTAFVVEVFTPSRDPALGGDGGFLFFGSNSAGQTAPSYIRADECGVPDFIDVASIGWPQTDIIIDPNLTILPFIPPCGSPQAGSCFAPHGTPNCSDPNCCQFLCALIDPTCCQLAWDVICVQEAMTFGECTLAPPPCQGLKAYECQAGCVDNFAQPLDPASPSADLIAGLNCGAFGDFDLDVPDHCIAHTFTGCWPSCGPDCPQPGCGTIVGATLAVHMRSLGGLASNDTLGLYDGGSVLWAANIGTLTGNPGWPLNADATIVLNLGPTPIPGTIQVPTSSGVLASLCDGELGMLVQDDTRVDYAKLTVFVCPCELGIRIPFQRDVADDFTSPTPTTPSAALLAHANCGAGSLQSYDVQALDQCFVETITGLPSCIMGATLTMGVRPDSLWWTDGLALDVVDQCGKVFKWSRSLTSLDAIGAFSPPLASGQLSTLTLDLGNLPPSADGTRTVLSTMLDGSLDIYLQDDTGVDFVFLEVLSCECGGGGPIGACCLPPEVPGGDYHCADLTQSQCEFNGGTWYGPSFNCGEIICSAPCVTPPWGMVAWYPLEPTTGIVADDITALQNDGTFGPQATGGPQSGPGVVGGAYYFNGQGDNITVPPDPSIDFSCKPFSIDLWVKRGPPGANPAFVNLVGTYGASTGGWIFGIDESTGQLEVLSESDCLRCIAYSTGTVPVGVWTHVAITVTGCDCSLSCFQAPNRAVDFYINGALAGNGTACCNLATQPVPAPIIIGGSVWVASPFKGGMDEIELFCRQLEAWEIDAIASAGSSGKCKQHCHASWDRQACMNFSPTAPADITICNDAGGPQTFTWFVTPSGSCPISGVTYSPSSGTTVVPPYSCVTIPITANVSGASGLGPACFDVTFINNSTGQACTSMGMMFVDICGIIVLPDNPVTAVPWDTATPVSFNLSSLGFTGDLPYLVKALPSDMESGNEIVSLNGLPPGTRYIGNLAVQPGQTTPLTFDVAFLAPDSFRWYDVILEIDPDGDGLYQPISSIGLQQVPAPECVGDLNHDGKVDAQDLGILLGAWGTGGVGDINGDGVVDAQDLGILLGAWGPC